MIEALPVVLLPLWPVLLASSVVGIIFGALGWRERQPGFLGRLGMILCVLALLGTGVLAVLGTVPGRLGLWLEIGLACTLSYVLGCLIGTGLGAARNRSAGQPENSSPAG